MAAPKKPSSLPGCVWIVWCALMFFAVFGAGGSLIERFVTAPHCASLCASDGGYDHFRVGRRSGSSAACICTSERAIETSLPDAAVGISVLAFLVACYAPMALLALRRSSDPRSRTPRSGPT